MCISLFDCLLAVPGALLVNTTPYTSSPCLPPPVAIIFLLQNEMQYLRIKTKKHEVIAAVGTCVLFPPYANRADHQSHLCSISPQQTMSSW